MLLPRARVWQIGGVAATVVVAVCLAVPAAASASSGRITITSGVSVQHVAFTSSAHKTVRGELMRIDLRTPGVSLNAGSPHQLLGTNRATIATQADASNAVGGINADFFDISTTESIPRGGLIRYGTVKKSPRPSWQANLYVDANNRAHIGAIPFTGTVSRAAVSGRAATSYSIYSVNTPADATRGHITMINSTLVEPLALPAGCTTVLGTTSSGRNTVTGVLNGLGWLPRLATNWWGLVACGGAAGSWLAHDLQVGDQVGLSMTLPNGKPRTAVGGGRVLIVAGRAYNDPDRAPVDLRTRNPETFACLSYTGSYVVLGALDGRSKSSAGVTYTELTNYLLQLKCYSAMVFDGGGSTTMVARLPGHHYNSVLNVPSDGRSRAVADGLFVYKS